MMNKQYGKVVYLSTTQWWEDMILIVFAKCGPRPRSQAIINPRNITSFYLSVRKAKQIFIARVNLIFFLFREYRLSHHNKLAKITRLNISTIWFRTLIKRKWENIWSSSREKEVNSIQCSFVDSEIFFIKPRSEWKRNEFFFLYIVSN